MPGSRSLSAAAAGNDLAFCAMAAKTYDAVTTLVLGAMFTAGGTVPPFFEWSEIVTPALISALTVPAHDDGIPFSSTIKLDNAADQIEAVSWVIGIFPGVLNAIAFYMSKRFGEEAGSTASESTRSPTSFAGGQAPRSEWPRG